MRLAAREGESMRSLGVRTSKRTLSVLTWFPPICMVLLFGVSVLSNAWWRDSTARMQERQKAAIAARQLRTDQLWKELHSGAITPEQYLEESMRAGDRHNDEMGAIWKEARSPFWLTYEPLSSIMLSLIAILLVVVRVLLGVAAFRSREEWHRNGYTWLGQADRTLLALALWGATAFMPHAEEFLAIPGNNETVGTLIEFLRLRKTLKQATHADRQHTA